jgi:hypothetical protein
MKFTKTYLETSFNSCYKPYYYIDNKRVTKEKFDSIENLCRVKGKFYNCASLTTLQNGRYKSTYYYNDYRIELI